MYIYVYIYIIYIYNPCWHSGEKLCQLNRWWAQPPATKCCLKIEPTSLLLNALPGRIAFLRLSAESFCVLHKPTRLLCKTEPHSIEIYAAKVLDVVASACIAQF